MFNELYNVGLELEGVPTLEYAVNFHHSLRYKFFQNVFKAGPFLYRPYYKPGLDKQAHKVGLFSNEKYWYGYSQVMGLK